MRRVRLVLFCFISILFLASPVFGRQNRHEGFVALRKGYELYVDFQRPAQDQPIAVLINGLTYDTRSWDVFANALAKEGEGFGILRLDFKGQGRTLLRDGPATGPFTLDNQVKDLKDLLERLRIRRPVHLIGLSYGGAIATVFAARYPHLVRSVILQAPFVAPLEMQDNWIRLQVAQTRLMQPWNPYSDDQLYDYFLRINIYGTFPAFEPVVLENPLKLEAIFRLAQGVRKYRADDFVGQLPKKRVQLMVALGDQYIPNKVHDRFWDSIPATARMSRLYVDGCEHKIPEDCSRFAASWVRLVMTGDTRLDNGITFAGYPRRGAAVSPQGTIENLAKD